MVPIAPRYDPKILEAVRALDDLSEPMAETARRVGTAAQRMGLIRPTYPHLRRLIRAERALRAAERAQREAMRELVADVVDDFVRGKIVHAYEVADRVADIRSRGP